MQNYLQPRHIGISSDDEQRMLQDLGVASVDELVSQVIPDAIRLQKPLDLPEPLTEYEHLQTLGEIAKNNCLMRNYIGQGFYPTATPSVIVRNVLENPVWYTSYTPYQAEVSQGRLEALFIFQTVVANFTGLPLANCSLLDEATAAAEAATMMRNLRSREQQKNNVSKLFVDERIFSQTLAVLQTRAQGQGIEIIIGDYAAFEPDETYFGAIVQWPNADGAVEDYTYFVEEAHAAGLKVTVIADILSLALLRAPGTWGADICCGSTQRMGIPMGYGGPVAGYMATRDEYKRDMPGRIIGLSKDAYGHPAYRLALQTREQHIKREKATSNICTAEALTAMMVGFYAVWHGADGIRSIAEQIHGKAVYLSEMLQAYGYVQENAQFFDTLKIRLPEGLSLIEFRQQAEEAAINFYYNQQDDSIGLSVNETTSIDDMNDLIELFAQASGNMPCYEDSDEAFSGLWALDEDRVRDVDYLQADVFRLYHTETEMMRFLKRLERKDISLTHSMIPLGSCTMKLNPASAMLPITWQDFMNIHPMAPAEQTEGYSQVLTELQQQLCAITGFEACTLQPTSGAAGEYTGLVIIRDYLHAHNQQQRNVLLIPASAHGTNPASCVQAGFTPIVVRCDEQGNTDIADWREKAEKYSDTLAGCMITYPSTHGIFETAVAEMCAIVHRNGGQVYMDGANMNAQIGYTNPATIGADVCHLNLHKSFASPHGGGGPGVGAVCVASHLIESLPAQEKNRVSTALYGNANMALISYGYIRMMGEEGLRKATATAILSANWLAMKLKDAYGIVYTGANGRVGHELILDCRQFKELGITENDIAKRLMDFGYHAPTLSFPVHGTLMVEPTESESLAELERFAEAMLIIRREIAEVAEGVADKADNVLLNAPHPEYEVTADEWQHKYSRSKAAYPAQWVAQNKFWLPVARVDNGYGDRNLVAKFEK
ncbi:MAG: aminomethyl-transferring glycine dehydrogenase [Paludibacter sp.]|nr:aminomethyl-transferring glycine dehydrogenase [Bacteroidales bacterium]MCM1069100.1 aminomethyl-transferring glycine dehydrogenase [Prevotella sp.]MCM1353539.1 aminomethyl-transferring glycine dehydrogenase [Bacteroides sp.]MCM1442700.1 aminomethyl-transferring glycine dehydrogenase [Muribaculum sp.]MCM1481664.1 aminomethyl-transferring glycine dehydrogenase [Paludibacter sp.]